MESFLRPKNVFIGDEAELCIRLSDITIDKKIFYNLDLKNKSLEGESISIKDLKILEVKDEKFLSIKFVAWRSGTVQFTSLKSYGVLSDLPSITVASRLNENQALVLMENRSALLIPGTRILFLAYAFLFIIFLIGAILLFKKLFKKETRKDRNKILRAFKKKIKKLFKRNNISDESILYAEAENILRDFLFLFFECFTNKNVFSLTYSEIESSLQNADIDKQVIDALEKIFHLLELNKFNNMPLNKTEFFIKVNDFFTSCNSYYMKKISEKG